MPREKSRSDRPFGLSDVIVIGAIVALAVRYLSPRPPAAAKPSPPVAGHEYPPAPFQEHVHRASEPGRGRGARYPWQIPLAGWKDILWRTYAQINEDRLLAVAAGVVFYGLLAIFPAITAFVSVYGLFTDSSTVAEHLYLISQVVPKEAFGPIEEQVQRVVAGSNSGLSIAFLVSLGLAIWSANAGMKAIIDALNVAYEETEKRGFIKLTLISLALTAGLIAAGLTAIGLIVVFPIVTSFLGVGSAAETLVSVLRWPLLFLALLLGLGILYRFGPSRATPRWQWVSVGGLLAAFLWLAGSAALSFYFSNFANYSATYGSLAAGIGLMTWLWLSASVILLGAELNSEIEHQTARDSTTGPERPLGARGAEMADTVGAAQG
ncbi:MAG: YihY/virulence factor BrkB family protein [Bauldia sp.]|nr:YihY/virulence factor BrkB family protein [Bauldia sp.]